MKKSTKITLFASSVAYVSAFSPVTKTGYIKITDSSSKTSIAVSTLSDLGSDNSDSNSRQPIFDPLGLYPKDSPERRSGLIQPMESSLEDEMKARTVVDPLYLYKENNQSEVSDSVAMSPSLPFLKRPEMLDGSLPGDRGFDPFNFSSDPSALTWYRESELKHARLAMLAAVGWPIAELAHNGIASHWDLSSILTGSHNHQVPSVLNGGLDKTSPLFWVGAISAAAALEFISTKNNYDDNKRASEPGDFNFDPLGILSSGKTSEKKNFFIREAEIFNGRLAMLAVTGFALQEFVLGSSVVDQTPIFFKSFGEVAAQLLEAGEVTSV